MSEDLVIGTWCSPSLVWVTPLQNGTVHHGDYLFMLNHMKDTLPPIQFHYYDLEAHATALLQNGTIDVSLFAHVMEPLESLSYSVPIIHTTTHIYTSKDINLAGKVVDGVFDWPSYLLLGLTLMTHFIVLGTLTEDWIQAFETTVAPFMRQQIGAKHANNIKRVTAILFMASTFVTSMYGSVIMAMLTIQKDQNVINRFTFLFHSQRDHQDIFLY